MATCTHGQAGYCYDDATPEQREAAEFLYRHAFEYSGNEEYAAWLLHREWKAGGDLLDVNHGIAFDQWLTRDKPVRTIIRTGRRTR